MTGFFFVACGGALGAAGRYAVSLLPVQGGFPVLTLVTNLLGAVLIGFVVGFGSAGGMTPNQTLFWKTGVWAGRWASGQRRDIEKTADESQPFFVSFSSIFPCSFSKSEMQRRIRYMICPLPLRPSYSAM